MVEMMKVWQLDKWGAENLHASVRETPRLGPADVLVQVRAVSLNYRDKRTIAGSVLLNDTPLPYTPCSDLAGEVVEGRRPGHGKLLHPMGRRAGDRRPVRLQPRPAGHPGRICRRSRDGLGSGPRHPLDGGGRDASRCCVDSLVRTDHRGAPSGRCRLGRRRVVSPTAVTAGAMCPQRIPSRHPRARKHRVPHATPFHAFSEKKSG